MLTDSPSHPVQRPLRAVDTKPGGAFPEDGEHPDRREPGVGPSASMISILRALPPEKVTVVHLSSF
jgi:hypothetical protein